MSYLPTAARLIAARYSEAGRAVYGGAEPEGEALARSYKYWRQLGRAPREALQRAALDYFRRDRRWPRDRRFGALGAPFGHDRLRWAEDPASIGLRFVGFADELVGRGRGIEHRGWYTDCDGLGETLRGAVYQLPGRKGRARYLAAYREGSEGMRGKAFACMAQCPDPGAPAIQSAAHHVGRWALSRLSLQPYPLFGSRRAVGPARQEQCLMTKLDRLGLALIALAIVGMFFVGT